MTFIEARNRAITEAMAANERAIIIGGFGGPGAPGLVVVAPGTPAGAYELMQTAVASNDPVVFVDSPTLHGETGEVPVGQGVRPARARVVRPGTDVTIVAVSAMVPRALRVAERL